MTVVITRAGDDSLRVTAPSTGVWAPARGIL